jgi:type II secretory pathway component PulF
MPRYRYQAFDEIGAKVSGEIEAAGRENALGELRSRGYFPVSLVEGGLEADWKSALGIARSRPGLGDLEFLTAELSLLLDSGVRIDRALGILQRARKQGPLAGLLATLSVEVKQGRQLSEALGAMSDVFDPLYVNLVALGEASGRLPEVFRGLAEDLRFRRELRQKILSAAAYPIVVAMVCVIAILFIFNFVVPNLQTLFADASELPWYTSLLLDSAEFMQKWQWLVAAVIFLIAFLLRRFRNSPSVVDLLDGLLIETPFLKNATLTVERVRFCSGLGLMLDAGLPVDRALTLALGNVRHRALRRELAAAVEKVKRGEQLSGSLRQTRVFPDYFASLLEVGEEGGELSRVFTEIARRSRNEFSDWALRLTTLLEPLLILVMGLIVGSVVVVMMLSITSVTDIGI